jgi:pimeloyl-ACP methyl ester carboxylesterase
MDFNYVVLPALIVSCALLIIWGCVHRLRSVASLRYARWRRLTEWGVLALLVVAMAGVAASSTINAVLLWQYRRNHPPPGSLYLVNGHRMYMQCSGNGSPTIILDAGLGGDDLVWSKVMPSLSQTTRVCAYDRAGYGWSEAVRSERDADHIADELHGLLEAANITGPIVLMGHSMGGMFIRDYASRYPQQVAGLIFVDSSTPFQNRLPAWKASREFQAPTWLSTSFKQLGFSAGIPRLLGQCSRGPQGEDSCHMNLATSASEWSNFDRSGEETVHTGPYGDLPVLIFSHDPQLHPSEMDTEWTRMQSDLKKLSSRSVQIIAHGSSHFIQHDRADLIEREVPLFIEQIRGRVIPEPHYGQTVTE